MAVIAPADLTHETPGTYRTDVGAVDSLRVDTVERTFTIRNVSPQPVAVTDVVGTCGCETLLLTQQGVERQSLTLAPAADADIHLSIRLNPYSTGPTRKYVYVYGKAEPGTPLLTIALDILLERSIAFDPPSVDFGAVTAGRSASHVLTVTVRRDLLAANDLPLPVSTVPDVTVRPVGAAQPVIEDGQPALRRSYAVSLSPGAPAGQISGEVSLTTTAGAGGEGPLTQTASLIGTVSSAVAATPATAFFGSLPHGTGPTRSVVLTLRAGASPSLTVSADKPWVKATLSPKAGASSRRLLTITLQKDAPVGDLQAAVTVALAGKASLRIPVVAELTK